MQLSQLPSRPQRGLVQYVVLGLVLVLAAGAMALLQSRKGALTNDLTASLVGSGGVTISAPANNATVTSPVQVSAFVAAGFTGPVRTMQVFADNALVYQAAGTRVDTSLTLSAGATHNLTVLALKQKGQLEGSATVYVTVPVPVPAPPTSTSVPALPPVPSP